MYPSISAAEISGHLQLDELHSMYWEQVGNADGLPVVILHGGPGGAVRPYYRQLVDPGIYRAVLFDQRGCGQSTPNGELRANTTQHLIADMEKLRQHLAIDRWLVIGGSWGSTLALAYAQTHPNSVAGLIVSGVFLVRPEDDSWWWQGLRAVYPEAWAEFRNFLPQSEQRNLQQNYLRRLLDDDPAIHRPAALAMMTYEAKTLDVWPDPDFVASLKVDPGTITMGRIHAHYSSHRFFLEATPIIDNAARLEGIRGHIIAGRFDTVTPPCGAWDLHQVWPRAELNVVPVAGHRWNDERLAAAMIAATDSYRDERWS